MDLSIYFEPLSDDLFEGLDQFTHPRLGNQMLIYRNGCSFPETSGFDIAIIGVTEDRASTGNEGCAQGADEIRRRLYHLFPGAWNARIADLGNIRQGYTIEDTYFALTSTIAALAGNKVLPVVIGGGQDLTFAMYKAYEQMGQIINMVAADPMFDLGETQTELNSRSYLSRIIMQRPNYLFNYTNLGYQTYFVDQPALDLMKKLLFDCYRLGSLTANIRETEPLVRNADLLSFDIGSIRAADAPGNANATPNGFTGDQACRIVRYAAMSDKLTSIGIFEYNPAYDRMGLTAMLAAQMIWYIFEGFNARKKDFPSRESESFIKYIVPTSDFSDGILFLKSRKTDRWWMEVICGADNRQKYASHYIVPCTYEDYQTACNNEIPDRWWQVYQKLM
ncbi:MAG TPA: formimidoylglutamase [Lentimicrobium sp.]|jgi:arginase family enzyme|nr:formimidoylglutamase [Lentimicrobium sp.]